MLFQISRSVCVCSLIVVLSVSNAVAQSADVDADALPEIPDEPKTIDPSATIPKALAVSATHDFSNSSLREVIDWLQEEHQLVVLLDRKALTEIAISPAEPVARL